MKNKNVKRYINITGLKFNRLLAIEYVYTQNRDACWLFKCECGEKVIKKAHVVKNNSVKSCGCLNKETQHLMRKNKIGTFHTKETKLKMSISAKNKPPMTEATRKKFSIAKTGRIFPMETRLKISKAQKGKLRPLTTGEKNGMWKGGITPINAKIRTSQEYKDWRITVFKRDNYTCNECGSQGVTLHADHIKPFAYYPELRLVIENGRTLCVPCHKKTDTYAGRIKSYVNKHDIMKK